MKNIRLVDQDELKPGDLIALDELKTFIHEGSDFVLNWLVLLAKEQEGLRFAGVIDPIVCDLAGNTVVNLEAEKLKESGLVMLEPFSGELQGSVFDDKGRIGDVFVASRTKGTKSGSRDDYEWVSEEEKIRRRLEKTLTSIVPEEQNW